MAAIQMSVACSYADGSKTTNKRRPRINAAPHQKNAVFTRG